MRGYNTDNHVKFSWLRAVLPKFYLARRQVKVSAARYLMAIPTVVVVVDAEKKDLYHMTYISTVLLCSLTEENVFTPPLPTSSPPLMSSSARGSQRS